MAHITKLTDKPRTRPWRAQVRANRRVWVKMFKTYAEAKLWADEMERNLRLTGLPLTQQALKKHTVGDLVRRYLKEKTPLKGCHVSETTVLEKFLRHAISKTSLALLTRKDAHDYIKERGQEVRNGKRIKPSTVRREINSIQHIFEVAREEWGFSNLPNHFRGLRIKGSQSRRDRRLKDGELPELDRACRECRGLNEFYVPLAIYLSIETAMRRDEMFELLWTDVDFEARRIKIRKSKTDHASDYKGRTIVLTALARHYLVLLSMTLIKGGLFKKTDHVFPMTKSAFEQSFRDTVKRARIVDLQFRDLRHEAASRFDEAGLTRAEHDQMMGHRNKDMHTLYISSSLKSIQDKLDRHLFGGMTLEEGAAKAAKEGVTIEKAYTDINQFAEKNFDSYRYPDIVPLLKDRAA